MADGEVRVGCGRGVTCDEGGGSDGGGVGECDDVQRDDACVGDEKWTRRVGRPHCC